jgi:hypothetical protein
VEQHPAGTPLASAAPIIISWLMSKITETPSLALPILMTRLTFAAWETVMRRTMMMALGTCPADEYQRMGEEKAEAMLESMTAVLAGGGHEAALAPFVTRARANARRLRRIV